MRIGREREYGSGSILIQDIEPFEKERWKKSLPKLEDCVRFKSVASDHIYLTTIVPGYFGELWHLTSLI